MGGSKNTQTNNTTQKTTAYEPAQAGINQSIAGVSNWMNDPSSRAVYDGMRTVDMSPKTAAGLDAYAKTEAPAISTGYLKGVIGGQGFNPYMDQLTEAVRASTMPAINASFSANGMGGSSMHQGVMAREIARATAPHLFGAYENDQSRRMQAAQMLPGIDERIGQRQIEAGQIGEGYDRERIAADMGKFNEQKYAGLEPYATGMGLLSGVGSQFGTQTGNSTQTTKNTPSLGEQIAGGAMMAGRLMMGNPMGMMGGAGMMGGGGGRAIGNPVNWMGSTGPYAAGLPWAPR
jgi:hypothetical protein